MPKPLLKTPPTSSVARLLDVEAATRAMSIVSANENLEQPLLPPSSQPRPMQEPMAIAPIPFVSHHAPIESVHVKRELVLSASADETLSQLIEMYRRTTGSRLSASHVARAMLRGVSKCVASLQREAEGIGRLKLPSNARGREAERDRFEDTIAQAFVNGIRAAASYRRDE